MNKLKDFKTTIMGVILMASEFLNMLGIEIPTDWKETLMLIGGGLLLVSGDPKMKDFISKNFREKIDHAESNFVEKEIKKIGVKQTGKNPHNQNVQTNSNNPR